MADIFRVSPEGYQEVRTGLGWRKVISPMSTEATTELPVIDLRDITDPDQNRRKAVAKSICDAAASAGFFYVRNHGVPDEVVRSIFVQTKRFFHDLSLEEKMEFDTSATLITMAIIRSIKIRAYLLEPVRCGQL
ncbi:hypothetical protein H2200_010180 [Cladophialophora chaetospira]|uniref:Non-haem dioxygenase N-terminal domain-containing protein n=1 Tax=Cladophialophora chaetospira TaxID=386627 RepID=A0AA38X2B5_9EURO|nr:hypothetical protein H2200_010180 [Cladophialophora chaetospira]